MSRSLRAIQVAATLVSALFLAFPVLAQCPGDCNRDGRVAINELIAAVGAALRGCVSTEEGGCRAARIEVDSPNFQPGPEEMSALGQSVFQINDYVYFTPGFSNTILIATDEGSVIIDTSINFSAAQHKQRLAPYVRGPVRYIILTHAHADHVGGVDDWMEEGTEVVAQRNHEEFLDYQHRLRGVFTRRNLQQFSRLFNISAIPGFSPPDAPVENHGGTVLATLTFDRFFEFRLGGLTFQLVHTPGETYDHLSVWIPELKAAFPGDNYYISFPNMYTLRGTRPRWALEYVDSLSRVLSWQPEILVPSHGNPIYGADAIQQQVGNFRDAILYVHDETVRGINAGKGPHQLMDEIRLPPELDQGELYGMVSWSVRGIYTNYLGWFEGNPSDIFSTSPQSVHQDLVSLAGGVGAVAERARELADGGGSKKALHLADVVLNVDSSNRIALEAKRVALEKLLAESTNLNEQGWLNAGILEVDSVLGVGSE